VVSGEGGRCHVLFFTQFWDPSGNTAMDLTLASNLDDI
jgi:hypothetical protein